MIVTESNIEKINDTFTQVKSISFNEKKMLFTQRKLSIYFLIKF